MKNTSNFLINFLSMTALLFSCQKALKEKVGDNIQQQAASSSVLSESTSTINRINDPVVLNGSLLSYYYDSKPNDLVAFKYTTNGWTQIPLQVDEKIVLDLASPYGPDDSPSGVNNLFYADPGTYVGADINPNIDADDEVVFMVKDAGVQNSDDLYPSGTLSGSKKEITISDPYGGNGYVYLFKNDGTLYQNAGVNYVDYKYLLLNGGTYPANFTIKNGRNQENSFVKTDKYQWHFAAEWISDQLIPAGGVDILDRHKAFFGDGRCLRSEDTFSDAENAFATNKTGPVRAIRSYMGANSGPYTQRTHLFYQGRQDIITNLRVHNIAAISDVFDYNSNANKMVYFNNLNTNGVTINGIKDPVVLGDVQWELVSGQQASLVILHNRRTTFTNSEAKFTSYYDDNKTKPASKCTGDGQAWGTSGVSVQFLNGNNCTDPIRGTCGTSVYFRELESRRIMYFEAANTNTTTAVNYHNQSKNPVVITIN